MAGRDAFVTSLNINIVFGLVFFLLFCVLRTRLRTIYSPRVKLFQNTPHAPPPLPPGLFAWIKPLIEINESTVTDVAGLDATMYLRYLYLSFQLFAASAIVGCGAVLPVNVYYDNLFYAELADGTIYMAASGPRNSTTATIAGNSTHEQEVSRELAQLSNITRPLLDRLSLTHVRDGSPIMWLHTVFVYLMTAYALYLIQHNFRGFAALRHKTILDGRAHHKWILVDNIPLSLRQAEILKSQRQSPFI